jgi:hypothetical protein
MFGSKSTPAPAPANPQMDKAVTWFRRRTLSTAVDHITAIAIVMDAVAPGEGWNTVYDVALELTHYMYSKDSPMPRVIQLYEALEKARKVPLPPLAEEAALVLNMALAAGMSGAGLPGAIAANGIMQQVMKVGIAVQDQLAKPR